MHIGAIAGLYFIGAGVLILPVHLLIEQSFNINLVLVSFVSLLGGSFLSWIFKKSPEAKELDRGLAHRWEWREVNTGNCLKNKSE